MRERIADFARAAGRFVPDATAASVIMLVILAAIALALGDTVTATVAAYYRGLWMLLPFSMQMTLILVLSGVVSATPVFRRAVCALAMRPRSVTQVISLSVAVTCALSYLYWGLGVALGPVIAVHFCRAAEDRGIRIDFPFLIATNFAAGSVWQFGLSSSAALLMATPGHFLEGTTGVMTLGTTIWSLPSVLLVILFPLALVAMARFLMPQAAKQLSAFPSAGALVETADPAPGALGPINGFSDWTERTRVFPLLLGGVLCVWLYHHFVTLGAGLDLNSMITMLLLAAVLMQGSLAAFSVAMSRSVMACWPVLVLYQLYGGVAGVLQFTSVGTWFAGLFSEVATLFTFPLLTAIGGTLVAIFVPSSGGQWIIQGFVTVSAAAELGLSPQLGLLALGIGDQMGNLLAPFWIVMVAGIARIDFREIFGHCFIFALLWFAVGVGVFTFVR